MSIIKTKPTIETAAAADEPMLTPEQIVEELRAIRNRIPEFVQLPNQRVKDQIRRTASVNVQFAREAISSIGASAIVQDAVRNTPEELHAADDEIGRWAAVESELHALLRGVTAANLVRRQRLGRVALQAYNISRELVKQEEHAELRPYVERMKRLPKFGRRRRAAGPEPGPDVATSAPLTKPV